MTPTELKQKFQSMTIPEQIRLSEWEDITNTQNFMNTQFQLIENEGEKYERTPAWERLQRFLAVIESR